MADEARAKEGAAGGCKSEPPAGAAAKTSIPERCLRLQQINKGCGMAPAVTGGGFLLLGKAGGCATIN